MTNTNRRSRSLFKKKRLRHVVNTMYIPQWDLARALYEC